MEKIEISDVEDNSEEEPLSEAENIMKHKVEKPLDPRAGRVDVELPQISFNPAQIVQLLSSYKFYPSSTAKSRRQLSRILDEYVLCSQLINYNLHFILLHSKEKLVSLGIRNYQKERCLLD